MGQVGEAHVNINDALGRAIGVLHIFCLPGVRGSSAATLWDNRSDMERDNFTEPIQLIEGAEYRFSVEIAEHEAITTDKPEIVMADDAYGKSGRLRPGLHVGGLPIGFYSSAGYLGHVDLEVRSTKLDYLSEYRWMLRDIANLLAELAIEYFAPTQISLTLDPARDSRTLYQQFAFLYAQIKDSAFEAAMAQILSRPHRQWVSERELGRSPQGLRPDRTLLWDIARSPKRQPFRDPINTWLTSLPSDFLIASNIETVDTPENRFIKFVLGRWVTLVTELKEVLGSSADTYRRRRGLAECDDALDVLNNWLSSGLFTRASELSSLPLSSPVLSRQEGYRDIFQIFLTFELAGQIPWSEVDDIYGAGQRDVATLYEYWVFLHLVKLVGTVCESYELGNLIEHTPNGLEFRLKRGQTPRLTGSCTRHGRQVKLELTFNHRFPPTGTGAFLGTWSRPLQPDYSLRIALEPAFLYASDTAWIHFDAKYRVDNHIELFGNPAETTAEINREFEQDSQARRIGRSRREDLYKMHTYLDAVKRTVGSYVIYPGTEEAVFQRGPEILPGIGAFPLRPTDTGEPEGTTALTSFLNNVIGHLAVQSTILERMRYWSDVSTNQPTAPTAIFGPGVLRKPPADTAILLVYEDSDAVRKWISSQNLLILARETGISIEIPQKDLGFDFISIFDDNGIIETWEAGGTLQLLTRSQVEALSFPGNAGEINLAFNLNKGPLDFLDGHLDSVENCVGNREELRRGFSRVVTMLDLIS